MLHKKESLKQAFSRNYSLQLFTELEVNSCFSSCYNGFGLKFRARRSEVNNKGYSEF